jgi:hypothetical protein
MQAFLANPSHLNWLRVVREVLKSMMKKGWGTGGIKN